MKPLEQDTQRLWDLVRHQRSSLHLAELITDDEYARLAQDHAAVSRLENWDRQQSGSQVPSLYENTKIRRRPNCL
jgi:hypothetical protein